MKLSEELQWRGYVNQTTLKDLKIIDKKPIKFYMGVDPSADSMTVGHLALMRMAACLAKHGHHGFLLVGGATGMIGDPDGRKTEREIIPIDEITANKQNIADQFKNLLKGSETDIVDNYDWFKDIGYLDFLRDIGKHVPVRQMLGRDFVSARMQDENAGLSYAEFSYVLIQAYDFLHLYKVNDVTLQICGSDQWGNSIAGVDLIRRKTGGEAHVLSMPLVINEQTGVKFGKSEEGAVWLDPAKTTPTKFYQFWINLDDKSAINYLKLYTDLHKTEIDQIIEDHQKEPSSRLAQKKLAEEVTSWVHGKKLTAAAVSATSYLVGDKPVGQANESDIETLKAEIPSVQTHSLIEALVKSGLASSNTEARRLITGNAISVDGKKTAKESLDESDFINNRVLVRRGKAFKDSALIEKP